MTRRQLAAIFAVSVTIAVASAVGWVRLGQVEDFLYGDYAG